MTIETIVSLKNIANKIHEKTRESLKQLQHSILELKTSLPMLTVVVLNSPSSLPSGRQFSF